VAALRRRILPSIPLVAALGLVASLLEGAGIGLFVPLLALMLGDSDPAATPAPIKMLTSWLNDVGIGQQTALLGAAIVGLIMLKNIVQALNDCLAVSIRARVGREIRSGLTRSLLSVDYSFYLVQDKARLTRIVSNDSWVVIEAAQAALALVPAASALIVFSVLLALLNLKLFLLVLVGAGAVQAVMSLLEARQRRLSKAFVDDNKLLWQRQLTMLQAPRVIRLFGQQKREEQRAQTAIERLWRSVRATNYLTAVVHPTVDALIALLFVALLLFAYWSGMSIPAITAFLLLLTRAQPHAKTISRSRLSLAACHHSLQEVDWLIAQAQAPSIADDEPKPLRLDGPIRFEAVSYTYPDGSRGLDGVSVSLEAGRTTALLGESGSGKTTLVNLLCRLIEPSSGAILLGDGNIDALNVDDWRARIAVAGQDSDLVSGTVAENIAYGHTDADRAAIEAVARAAGAHNFIMALPRGYDSWIEGQGLNLSGGQRQRIGIARALLRRPDLLIFDEATNAVDALSDLEIMKLATEHKYFGTLLLISHRKSTIAACERGIVLSHGRVTESGPLEALGYFRSMGGANIPGAP
jgi:subfamily B ATP-binding cassette protein MsbA